MRQGAFVIVVELVSKFFQTALVYPIVCDVLIVFSLIYNFATASVFFGLLFVFSTVEAFVFV